MYELKTKVLFSQINQDGYLPIEKIVDYFQDVATAQSEELGVGMHYLNKINRAWLLSSWQVEVKRYPVLGEDILVQTWPHAFKGFLGYRNARLCTTEGEELAIANAIWTYVDTEVMHPARLTDDIYGAYTLEEKIPMDYASRKITVPAESEIKQLEPVVIKQHHLDTNHHVNNGQYIVLAADCLPEHAIVNKLRAEYKDEAVLGDVIYPKEIVLDNKRYILLQNKEGKDYCVVEFEVSEC